MPPTKKSALRTLVCGGIASLLAGCASTWTNPYIPDKNAMDRQLVMDNGYCKRVAIGAAPMPAVNVPVAQAPQGYNVTGTSTTYGYGAPARTDFTGRVTPYQPGGAAAGFANGFSGGVAQGAAVGNAIRARRDQDEVFKGCMYQLGWQEW